MTERITRHSIHMNSTAKIKDVSSTLTEEQIEAFWPRVESSSIISELYAVSAVDNIYGRVTPDEIRDLTRIILDQYEDDTCECCEKLREALLSRTHTVQALIKFRVGNYAEFDFVKSLLPKHTLQRLVWNAITIQN